jgi:hypothetical protein
MGRNRRYKTNADRQRAYRRRKSWALRARSVTQAEPSVDTVRQDALARFKADPTKCYQRHIREVMADHDPRPPLPNLKSATVSQISNALASAIILRFEWLGTMATDTRFCYGLWPSDKLHFADDLLGAVCFAKGGNRAALESVAPYDRAMILARGACSMRAGRNAASFLISRACKKAARDHGFTHFLAYSDPEAGERGTIYRALNWQCLGVSEQGDKTTFKGPHGARISSYDFNGRGEWKFRALGWDGEQAKYDFLRSLGWTEERESKKLRWLWVQSCDLRPFIK